jgi:hypothetical protein
MSNRRYLRTIPAANFSESFKSEKKSVSWSPILSLRFLFGSRCSGSGSGLAFFLAFGRFGTFGWYISFSRHLAFGRRRRRNYFFLLGRLNLNYDFLLTRFHFNFTSIKFNILYQDCLVNFRQFARINDKLFRKIGGKGFDFNFIKILDYRTDSLFFRRGLSCQFNGNGGLNFLLKIDLQEVNMIQILTHRIQLKIMN